MFCRRENINSCRKKTPKGQIPLSAELVHRYVQAMARGKAAEGSEVRLEVGSHALLWTTGWHLGLLPTR